MKREKGKKSVALKKRISKRLCAACLCLGILISLTGLPIGAMPTEKDERVDLGLDCKSAILMESSTGTVLYEQNADAALPPASVTKIMTLLLVMAYGL